MYWYVSHFGTFELAYWRIFLCLAVLAIGVITYGLAKPQKSSTMPYAVTYDNWEAIRQYQAMQDVEIGTLKEQDRDLDRRLRDLEAVKIDARLSVMEQKMDNMEWWHRAIAGATIVSLVGIAFNIFLHLKRAKLDG